MRGKPLQLLFRKKESRSWDERLSEWWTSIPGENTYCHVEVRFSNGYATSICRDPGIVHYERRVFSDPSYSCVYSFILSEREEQKLIRFARDAKRDEVAFDGVGMFWNFIPCMGRLPVPSLTQKSFFCSQYIVTLLNTVGIFRDIDPDTATPTMLAYTAKSSRRFRPATNKIAQNKNLKHVF